jgi:amidophosphoribosyltransferase
MCTFAWFGMCGIFGVIGNGPINVELAYGLHFLTHRGPQAAGFMTLDDQLQLHVIKDKGIPKDIVENRIDSLEGRIGIGHTRYATVGKGGAKNAQPNSINLNNIALAHNGHVINQRQIEDALNERYGYIHFNTDNDAERILYLFNHFYMKHAKHFQDTKELVYNTLNEIMQHIVGSYSAVSIIPMLGLVGFRDPHGIRPMLFGKKIVDDKTYYAFASESIALEQNEFTDIRDVQRGEAIIIDKDLHVESRILKQLDKKFCKFEYIYFSEAISVLEGKLVNDVRYDAGELFARTYYDELKALNIDFVQAIPYTPTPAAIAIGDVLGIDDKQALQKYRYGGRIFLDPNQALRNHNTSNFIYFLHVFRNKNVLLVDDSIVRGTNSRRIVEKIKSVAKNVYFASLYPPYRHPCYYGIDTPKDEDLVAHDRDIEEIRQIIGPDKLFYNPIENVIKAIGFSELCKGCTLGEYPTDINPGPLPAL